MNGWLTQEYFNQYLDVKSRIINTVNEIKYLESNMEFTISKRDSIKDLEKKLENSVKEMKVILEQLRFKGVTTEYLLFLSIDVDLNYFE